MTGRNIITMQYVPNSGYVAVEKVGWFTKRELDDLSKVKKQFNQIVSGEIHLPKKHEKNIRRYYWRLKSVYGEFAIAEIACNTQSDFLNHNFDKTMLNKCTFTMLENMQQYISAATIRRRVQKEQLSILVNGTTLQLQDLIHTCKKNAAKELVIKCVQDMGEFNTMTEAYTYYANKIEGKPVHYRQFTNYLREIFQQQFSPSIINRKTKCNSNQHSLPPHIWRMVERVIK